MRGGSKLLFLTCFLLLSVALFAQEKKEAKDSLIRLIEASSAQLQEVDGVSYRKILGPAARFFHNDTYLICDTAMWNVNTNVIHAIGNVQIIQENTYLTSDKIDYIIDKDLAQFRGSLVELFDKEGNVLRTNYLDYNTKDSVATFYSGGAMRNKDGNIIESQNGEYRSADKMFSFRNNVQMFTDSVFIKSNKVDYNTVENKALFGPGTTAWQEDDMLFSNGGEFDRENNIFNFNKDSYILTNEQELWADTLSYNRNTGVARLYSNIQILDTVQQSLCFADKAVYTPDPKRVELTKSPSVAMYTLENGVRDTMFMAADTINYYTIRHCDIDSTEILKALERVKLSNMDPLVKLEEEAAAKRKANEDAANSPFINAPKGKDGIDKKGDKKGIKSGSTTIDKLDKGLVGNLDSADSLITTDSLAIVDSLGKTIAPKVIDVTLDTTSIAFIDAWHKVKIFKSDTQALCDSLVYTGLDSMARMYINPVMWNDIKHQFTSDSIQVVLKNNVLSKANLISNAFIASQEDSVHFNQIKGAEMVAYFRDNDLYRYDALGGASMIFYVEEDSVITMMNQKEGKIISARLKDRKVQRIKYFEDLKNNLLPTFNLPIEDQRLRGFVWRGDERPQSRFDIVNRQIQDSKRAQMACIEYPDYPYTGVYFSSTRDSILQYRKELDSLRFAKELAKIKEREIEKRRARQDSLLKASHIADSLDSVKNTSDSLRKSSISGDALLKDDAQQLDSNGTNNIFSDIVSQQAIIAAKQNQIDSLQAMLLPKDELASLSKDERKATKKEQKALRKSIRKEKRALKKLERVLIRFQKKNS